METKFLEAFKETLEREDEINLTDEFRTYPEWDSLAYLSVIAMLDENYGVQIELADFRKQITIGELMNEVFRRSSKA
jgi:acyl carrier protein